jgi:hypothetical protein
MDMETVLPIKTVSDIMKEIAETDDGGCSCENCNCKDEPIEEES